MSRWPFYSDQELRAMYPDGRADETARRLARVWVRLIQTGLLPRRWVTLEVTGRRSGRLVQFPLGMSDWNGQWYLVSMLGEQCNWVRNVRAAQGQVRLRRRSTCECLLTEVKGDDRAPVIRRYLRKVPGARPHIPVDRHAPLADFAAISARYPVFRVTPQKAPEASPSPPPRQ